MKNFLALFCVFAMTSTAMALAPQGEDFEAGLRATAQFKTLASEAKANDLKIAFESLSADDLSINASSACGLTSRSAQYYAVRLVNSGSWVIKTVVFNTTERARDLKPCFIPQR